MAVAEDYASWDDLTKHWVDVIDEDHDEAVQKLHEASVEIRALYPDLDDAIANGTVDPDVPRLVACRMVKRAMDAPPAIGDGAGVTQATTTTGPFSQNLTFSNPDGAVYLSGADKRLLRTARGARRPSTIHPSGGALGWLR